MLKPKRPLQLVDPETGEVSEHACPHCAEKQLVLDELTRKYHGALAQIGKLRADADAEARADQLWPTLARMFESWREWCNHPRSAFSAEAFELARKRARHYAKEYDLDTALEIMRLAILGAAEDPFTTRRKNGSTKRFDSWELIFRNNDNVEDFASRAPRSAIEASPWEVIDGAWRIRRHDETP